MVRTVLVGPAAAAAAGCREQQILAAAEAVEAAVEARAGLAMVAPVS
jgi:hypothetical protein